MTTPTDRLVAAKVRAAIAFAGYTPNAFAPRIGKEQTWLSRRLKRDATVAFTMGELAEISEALGIDVLAVEVPARESAAAAGAGSGPPPRYRPEPGDDDDGPISAPFSLPADRTADKSRTAVTSRDTASAERTRPPSGPGARHGDRTVGPASRRPRVNARLVGAR